MTDHIVIEGESTAPKETALTKALAKKGSQKAEAAYAADAGNAQEASEDTLQALRNLAQQVVDGERAVAEAEEKFKKAAQSLAMIQEDRLPKLMQQKGIERFDFIDRRTGLKQVIKLDDKLRVGMPTIKVGNSYKVDVEKCKPIYSWLRSEGEGAAIKKTIEVPAGLIDDERAARLMDHIKNFDNTLDPGLTEKIEPATLTSLITKMREKGKNIHEDIRVTPVIKAKVSSK